VPLPRQRLKLGSAKDKEHAMSEKPNTAIAAIGIDIGKNYFHLVGLDERDAIALRQKWSRDQLETRLANLPPCLVGMEACVEASGSRVRLTSQTATSPYGDRAD
jgi:transposase